MRSHQVARRPYVWLAALTVLLSVFVPFASSFGDATGDAANAQETPQQEEPDALLDVTPESVTVLVPQEQAETQGVEPFEGQTLTAKVTDPDGNADEGRTVTFEVTDDPEATNSYAGGHAPGPIGACETDADGMCEFTVPPAEQGKDNIRATVEPKEEIPNGDAPPENPIPLVSLTTSSTTTPSNVDNVTITWVTAPDEGAENRLGGEDRFETAVKISQELFPDDESADAVVLARSDKFPDSLTGTPFAKAVNAPILLTRPDTLNAFTTDELERVLAKGKTVYILGEEEAVSNQVQFAIELLGYDTERIGGETRMETAIEIAERLDNPSNLIITAGSRWPDAVVAGAAAAANGDTAILLSGFDTTTKWANTEAYLESREGDAPSLFAVGGPAVNPYVDDERMTENIWGDTRFATGIAVAEYFFGDVEAVGLARSGETGTDIDPFFADSLTGGVHVGGALKAPMLLTPTDTLSPLDVRFICYQADVITDVWAYGENEAIADDVLADAAAAARAENCVPFDEEPTWTPHN